LPVTPIDFAAQALDFRVIPRDFAA